ncbi:MAG: 16S rRNA (uracil(1498)-N(3))-methyltransferase, partial [Bifidobacteriaceae bacterium]|nr:16S rRNA (uracil(1498)-N(3))-methyltransferase [Bifidobacteriaceae bacterium]
PWQAARSVVRGCGGPVCSGRADRYDKAGKSRDRWQQLARAEAKVARRPRVPSVALVVDTKALVRRLNQAIGEEGAVAIALDGQATGGLSAALAPVLPRPVTGSTGDDRPAPADGVGLAETPPAAASGRLAGGSTPPAVYLVTGPEGGISQAELDQLTRVGAVTARLGPEVLRAGLAGPAALAVLSHLFGRWA